MKNPTTVMFVGFFNFWLRGTAIRFAHCISSPQPLMLRLWLAFVEAHLSNFKFSSYLYCIQKNNKTAMLCMTALLFIWLRGTAICFVHCISSPQALKLRLWLTFVEAHLSNLRPSGDDWRPLSYLSFLSIFSISSNSRVCDFA